MTSTLLTGIAELVTNDAPDRAPGASDDDFLGLRRDAALVVADGRIEWVGAAADAPAADDAVDLDGRCVVPGFVDSHNHLVFAGDRSAEFAARMTGQRYDGGGIATTVRATREATDDRLRALATARAHGATSVEDAEDVIRLLIDAVADTVTRPPGLTAEAPRRTLVQRARLAAAAEDDRPDGRPEQVRLALRVEAPEEVLVGGGVVVSTPQVRQIVTSFNATMSSSRSRT